MILEEFHVIQPNGRKRLKVRYKCDSCGKIKETHKDNIAKKKIHECKGCVFSKLRKGQPSKKKGKSYKHLQRENAAKWNGGRYINSGGYVMILVKSGSTNRKSGWENYRPEHIIVMEKTIGRKLRKNECIHHIDGNRQNNEIENLALIKSNEHHRKTHMSLQKIGYQLYIEEKVKFNKEIGEYYL